VPKFRGQRVATLFLDGIEKYLVRANVTRLRINALAVNTSAHASYRHTGFVPYEILRKKLTRA
jgi:GNAT superfamily N-acetyltransferase